MIIRCLAIVSGFLALSQILTGCVGTRPGRGLVTLHGLETTQAGKSWSIDIQSVLGRVDVEVDPELTLPRLLAKAPNQTNAADPAIYVGAVAGPSEEGNVLKVSVAPAVVGGGPTPVSLHVRTPSCVGVRVHNSGGGVRLSGVSGSVEVMSGVPLGTGGPITVTTRSDLTQGVKLVTSDGNILLMMGEKSSGVLDVRGTSGVSVELPDGAASGVSLTSRQWKGSVGANPASISVISENGSCDVRFNQQPRSQSSHRKR